MCLRIAEDSAELLDNGEEVSLQRAWEFVHNFAQRHPTWGPLKLQREFVNYLGERNVEFVFHLSGTNSDRILGTGRSPRAIDAARNAVLDAAVEISAIQGEWRGWKSEIRKRNKGGSLDPRVAEQVQRWRKNVAAELNSLLADAAGNANPRFIVEMIEDQRKQELEHCSEQSAARHQLDDSRAQSTRLKAESEEFIKTAEIARQKSKDQAAQFAQASRKSLEEKETLQKTLDEAENALKGVKEECEQLRKELERSQRELETTKAKDEERKKELERCREELRQMRAERAFALTADAETMSETSEDSDLEQLFAFAVERSVSPQLSERSPVELNHVLEDLARVKLRLDTLEARPPA